MITNETARALSAMKTTPKTKNNHDKNNQPKTTYYAEQEPPKQQDTYTHIYMHLI